MQRPILRRACPVFLLTATGIATALKADVLYSNLQGNVTGSQTTSYTVSNQGSGPAGFGQYYNTGYDSITLDSFSFYGGLSPTASMTRPLSAGASLAIYFYDAAGTFVDEQIDGNTFTTGGSEGNVGPGVGLKTFSNLNLTIPGAGYVVFIPVAEGYQDVTTGANYPAPTGPCNYTGYFGSAPSVGETDPTLSETGDISHSTINSVSSLVTAPAYLQLQMTGTGSGASYYPTATPNWSAGGSGNWDDSSNWTLGVPDASGSTANFVQSITANSSVTVTAGDTVGIVNFDSPNTYTIGGSGTLTLSNSSNPAVINSWAGSQVISAPIVYSAGLAINTPFADPGASSPDLTLSLNISATGTLTKTGIGTLSFNASQSGITVLNLPALNISGGTVVLQSNSSHANRTLLTTASLQLISSATLNLGKNDLDDSGDTLSSINALVASGYANGAWNGNGIDSSAAASNSTHLTALGVILNNQGGSPLFTAASPFDGTTPGTSDILVKYTYYGDTNLDGKVDGTDYSRIDNAYLNNKNSSNLQLTGWFNGDFNYDGVINGSDYTLIDNAFNTQGVALTAEIASSTAQFAGAGGTSAVPEPASIAAVFLGCIGLLGRRRT